MVPDNKYRVSIVYYRDLKGHHVTMLDGADMLTLHEGKDKYSSIYRYYDIIRKIQKEYFKQTVFINGEDYKKVCFEGTTEVHDLIDKIQRIAD